MWISRLERSRKPIPLSRTIKYGFFQPLILLKGGYFDGSGAGIDSRPVGCRGFVAWVSTGGAGWGLEQATRAPSRVKATTTCTTSRTLVRKLIGTTFLRPPLSPHRMLAEEYRFKCGLRFFRQVVGLIVVRELVRSDVGLEGQYGLRDQRGGVSVAADEFRWLSKRQVDEIVEH